MKKLAIFVEGQTEQLFVERLLKDIAGERHISIDSTKAHGGKTCPRTFTTINAAGLNGERYYALIYDSSCDSRVVSDILEKYWSLVAEGYTSILGLRDLHPLLLADLGEVKAAMDRILSTDPVRSQVIVAVMEIEAWFVAEDSHFAQIDSRLDAACVRRILTDRGEDVAIENISQPSKTLNAIYSSASRHYTKDRKKISSIVDRLDTARLYLQLSKEIASLQELCRCIDDFLTNDEC